MGVGVGRFLARGRPARLAACAVVVFAAVVWLSVAIVVLRVVFVVALLLVAVWCAWLVAAVWWRPVEWKGPSLAAVCRLWARVRLAFAVLAAGPSSAEQGARGGDEPGEALLAGLRRSAEAVSVELLGRQERLHADAESLQRALAGQIETIRDLVARIAQVEQEVSRLAGDREPTIGDSGRLPADDLTADPDLRSAFEELERARAATRPARARARSVRCRDPEPALLAFARASRVRLEMPARALVVPIEQ